MLIFSYGDDMKKNIIIICLLLLTIIIVIIYGFNKRINVSNVDAILLNDSDVDLPDYVNMFSDYYSYKRWFTNDVLTKSNFENNNYAVIKVNYDPCSDEEIKLVNYSIVNNILNADIEYKSTCGVCAPENMYYFVKIDKNVSISDVNINYKLVGKEPCDDYTTKKPMIYIYPEHDMNISIKLDKPELLTTTYPRYNNGWNVYAKTNGDLIINDRLYYGLYWEGINNINNSFEDGFIVNKDNLIDFLENKLSILGLNEKEANEFIVYWLPILEKNEYNLIRFENINEINKQMNLEIDPKPDTLIRILMEYKPVDKDYNIKEQKLDKVIRNGYTVVEWGGTLIKS